MAKWIKDDYGDMVFDYEDSHISVECSWYEEDGLLFACFPSHKPFDNAYVKNISDSVTSVATPDYIDTKYGKLKVNKWNVCFKPYDKFDKTALEERTQLLYQLVKIIWEVE